MLSDKAIELGKRANRAIAHGALTNSKRPESHVRGVYPMHFRHGNGCNVTDVDGNVYIDYISALGVNLYGYGNPRITKAVTLQLTKGAVFSMGSELEVEYAERIQGAFPYMQRMRFLKTGSEACSAAIRIARVFTEKYRILSEGYHGWHDPFISITPPAYGVNSDALGVSPLENTTSDRWFLGIAAVIVEPVLWTYDEERIEYLRNLRDACDRSGTVLIFDETITALRFPGLSVAKYLGIDPDISIMGKALGGGLPLYIVGGRKDIMESDYFVSSTFGGDCLALAAGVEVLNMQDEYPAVRLWENGKRFMEAFNEIAPDVVKLAGYPTRGVFQGATRARALFFQEAVRAGVLFGPSWLYSHHHEKHDEHVLNICKTILHRIRAGGVKLRGRMPVSPFAERVRGAA